MTSPDWRSYAACTAPGVDPELFWPPEGSHGDEARAICDACPVRKPCLEYALATNQRQGIWGGLGSVERRQLRKARQQAA
jgi:WhiB family redox-sensing transcriptional regulator